MVHDEFVAGSGHDGASKNGHGGVTTRMRRRIPKVIEYGFSPTSCRNAHKARGDSPTCVGTRLTGMIPSETFIALLALLSYLFSLLSPNPAHRLPPGPKPWPLLGNIRDLRPNELWLLATDWAKRYGPSLSLSFFA